MFGTKGAVDLILRVEDRVYEVSLLSFVSTHGRWNMEKLRDGYAVEVRRESKLFYKRHYNSNAPEHVSEYKGEFRVCRRKLALSPKDPTLAGQILLVYPRPNRITYTDARYHEIGSGETIDGHMVMSIEDLHRLVTGKKEK